MLDFNLNDLCGKTDEELALLARTDKSAAAALLSRYSQLILIKSKIYANSETDSEDLHQEGFMSLLKAINAYDQSKGAKFSTFAEVCIVNRMRTIAARSGKVSSNSESIDDETAADVLSVEETPESIYLYNRIARWLKSWEYRRNPWTTLCRGQERRSEPFTKKGMKIEM